MDPISIAAIGGLVTGSVAGMIQFVRWIQELRERKALSDDTAAKAGVEKDSIAIKNADQTLLMMKGMLELAKLSEGELRIRVRDLEAEGRASDKRVFELEHRVRDLEDELAREREERSVDQKLFEERLTKQAEAYEERLSALENGGNNGMERAH